MISLIYVCPESVYSTRGKFSRCKLRDAQFLLAQRCRVLVTRSNTIVVIASASDRVFLILPKIPLGNYFASKANPLDYLVELEIFRDNLRMMPFIETIPLISRARAIFGIPSSYMTLQLTFVKSIHRSSRWI